MVFIKTGALEPWHLLEPAFIRDSAFIRSFRVQHVINNNNNNNNNNGNL